MVRESALEETPWAKPGPCHSTGHLCRSGWSQTGGDASEAARAIRNYLRPVSWPKDTVVILGAGLVRLRKGVDLFIACARRVAEMMPKRRFRFVWIGDGFNPEQDVRVLGLVGGSA